MLSTQTGSGYALEGVPPWGASAKAVERLSKRATVAGQPHGAARIGPPVRSATTPVEAVEPTCRCGRGGEKASPRVLLGWALCLAAAMFLPTTLARADQCDEVVARVEAVTGAKLTRRIDDFIAMRHPLFRNIQMRCGEEGPGRQDVTLWWGGDTNRPRAVDLITRIGEIELAVDKAMLRKLVARCLAQPPRTGQKAAHVDGPGVSVDCDPPAQSTDLNRLTVTSTR